MSLVKSRPLKTSELHDVYKSLRKHFGHQKWWPGETPFEVMVGAILTQNTAWINVEKAISNLKNAKVLTPSKIQALSDEKLASLIRPAGYFNVKTKRMKNYIEYFIQRYKGSITEMRKQDPVVLRKELLEVNGIGEETADSIILYAVEKKTFVIDAYTRRIFSRHRIKSGNKQYEKMTYREWQHIFEKNLPKKLHLYNDFHAQIVMTAKEFCQSRKAKCDSCPMQAYL